MPAQPWITNAKARQGNAGEIARILDQYDLLTPQARAAFLRAIEDMAGRVDVARLAELIRANNIQGAIALVQQAQIAAGASVFAATMAQAVVQQGVRAARAIPLPKAVQFEFSSANPRTIAFLRQYQFGLIREISQQAREAVAVTVRAGVEAGQNPIATAMDVRANIGLTGKQAQAVSNYRRMLTALDPTALQRVNRDTKLDAQLQRAIDTGTPLTSKQIDRMVERYRWRTVKVRAETIARTESIRAVNAGNKAAWQQAVDEGAVAEERVTRKWVYTRDPRTRDAHRKIPDMNPDGVGLNEPFQTPLGPLMYPGDPAGAAANTINCRCTQIIRYRASVDDDAPRRAPAREQQGGPDAPPAPPQDTRTPAQIAAEAEAAALGQRIDEARGAAQSYVYDEGRRSGVEQLRWLDLSTGELMDDRNSGERGFVGFTPAFAAAIEDPLRHIEAHHNHPSSSSFSRQDLAMMDKFKGLKRLYAEGHNGSVYIASDVQDGISGALADMQRNTTLRPYMQDLVSKRAISPELASQIHQHAAVSAVSGAGYFRYEYQLPNVMREWIEANPELFDRAVAHAKVRPMKKRDGKDDEARTVAKRDVVPPAFIDPPSPLAPLSEWRDWRRELAAAARRMRRGALASEIAAADAWIAKLEREAAANA